MDMGAAFCYFVAGTVRKRGRLAEEDEEVARRFSLLFSVMYIRAVKRTASRESFQAKPDSILDGMAGTLDRY